MRAKKVNESKTTMTELIMPNDTNPLDNLMGGNLMRWMDTVAGICAARHCEAYVVTASVDHISFTKPINLGDVITLEAQVTRAFNTSVEVFVEVFATDMKNGNPRRSNHAYFTMVAVDDVKRKPMKVPEVIPLTNEEQKLFDAASRRREIRLVLSGRISPDQATDLKALFGKISN